MTDPNRGDVEGLSGAKRGGASGASGVGRRRRRTRTKWKVVRRWPKRNSFHKNSRLLLANVGLGGGSGATAEERLRQISGAVSVWEAKLVKFAEKFSGSPAVLSENPTWVRLLQVRDALREMLAKAELQALLDQTRM